MKNMTKIVALILSLLMTFACASAEEVFPQWSNGQSARQPYSGVPPVDLTEQFGYMMYMPINGSNEEKVRVLRIYLPRTDVECGSGTIRIHNAQNDEVVDEYAFSDTAHVTLSAIPQSDCAWLKWEDGLLCAIHLRGELPMNQTYYVTMDEDCLTAAKYGVSCPALKEKTGWSFSTNGTHGVTDITWPNKTKFAAKVNQPVKLNLILGGEVVAASAYTVNGESYVLSNPQTDDNGQTIQSETDAIEQSGELTIQFAQPGAIQWSVLFLNTQDEIVDIWNYTTEVTEAD